MKVEVAVLVSPSLIVVIVYVDVKQPHLMNLNLSHICLPNNYGSLTSEDIKPYIINNMTELQVKELV